MRARHADVVSLDGLSAHADQRELVAFAEAVRDRGRLRKVVLVHGEPTALAALAGRLTDARFPTVVVPNAGDRVRI
jgi:metallo-beta-lactamase family protein